MRPNSTSARWLGLLCACAALAGCESESAREPSDEASRHDASDSPPVREAGAPPDASRIEDAAFDATSSSANDAAPAPDDTGVLDAGPVADAALDAEAALQVTVLRDARLDSGVAYQLLRLSRADGGASYAQWFPPPDGGVRPVVVATKPYDGIDWSGEAVDGRWAARGAGLWPDVDGPKLADGGAPQNPISYTPLAPDKADEYFLYGLHNFGTLLIYGRFYAGGDVQNDIDDMILGFDFLAQRSDVDRSRIGVFGGSWGGFEALYAAAYARDEVKPKVGVGLSPLSDFEQQVAFVERELPALYTNPSSESQAALFFEPYLRRVNQTRAAQGGFEGLRAQDLAARMRTRFLLIHEDWDTLVPFAQSAELVRLAPERFAPFWILHPAPPASWDSVLNGHGPLLTEYALLASYTFLQAFLLRELGDVDQTLYAVWDRNSMGRLFAHMHALQRAGKDVGFFAQRLRELTDPRLIAFDLAANAGESAVTTVARALNAEWKTSWGAAELADKLAGGLPAP